MRTAYILLGAFFLLCQAVHAQGPGPARIDGRIFTVRDGARVPLDYVRVTLPEYGLLAVTDAEGAFRFENLSTGRTPLNVAYVGMESIDTLLTLRSGVNEVSLRLFVADFRMDEVVVTARNSSAGQATSSMINRQAIDHLQASSLADVMTLLPGVRMTNPDMGSPNILNVRGTGTQNSMGTALIIDGAQQSNNANLQMLSPTAGGSTADPLYFRRNSDNAAGIDTRTVPLDNIESVEVIRGIPSAEYGDLTSGAVVVKTRAGREPLRIKASIRPEQYQASIAKGFGLGEKGGNLNLSADYLYAIKRPIESYWNYRRLSLNSLWSKRWNPRFNTNTSLRVHYGFDKRSSNPDDAQKDLREGGRDIMLSFNHNGTYNINIGWWKSLEYVASARYNDKVSWKENTLTSALGLYSTAMQDGTVVSNWPGRDIYDSSGALITNIPPGSESARVIRTPDEYFSRYDVYGREIYVTAGLKTTFYKSWGAAGNRIMVGVDFKAEGNRGRGKIWDADTPPRPPSGTYRAYRERAYTDIPFLKQLGAYVEDKFHASLWGGRELNLSAGVRYDSYNGLGVFAPRLNASFDLVPRLLTLRGGYGVSAKAPMILYLYPENAYFDVPLFNEMSSTDPAQRLIVARTSVFSASNPDLKVATNRTAEIGLDLSLTGGLRFSVTAYEALHDNGYSMSRTAGTFRLLEQETYSAAAVNPGDIPTLVQTSSAKRFVSYYIPQNTAYTRNRGVEYVLDLGRIEAIRTAIVVDGAWTASRSFNKGNSFVDTPPTTSGVTANIGIYEPGRVVDYTEGLITTVRLTHNIPRIGFVVTLTAQIDWYRKAWSKYGSDMFVQYISGVDGQVYDFDPARKDDIDFVYLFTPPAANRSLVEKTPTTVFFNLNLTKEIGSFLRASFFANNVFFSKPRYRSTKYPSNMITLGNDIYFGFDLQIVIK